MKKTMMVVLLCGVVSLTWGNLLWAGTATSQPPSQGLPWTGMNPSNVRGSSPSNPVTLAKIFATKPGLPASMIPGTVFEAKQDPATGAGLITYRLQKAGPVVLTVSDAKGQTIWERLYSAPFAGLCRVVWDGKGTDSKGVFGNAALKPVSSGIYTLKMTSPDGIKTTQFTYNR